MTLSAADDDELWRRSLAHDAAAFRVLFERHRDRVFGHALRFLLDPSEADDVMAAAFLELWRRREQVAVVDDSVLPWLLVTATNLSRNRIRARWRYGRLLRSLPREPPDDAEQRATAHVEREEQRRTIRRALTSLSEQDAALLALTAIEGMTTAAAAEAVGVSPGAARTRLSRVRARLRTTLAELRDESTTETEGIR